MPVYPNDSTDTAVAAFPAPASALAAMPQPRPAQLSLKRLAQATGLSPHDRLLIIGVVDGEALAGLVRFGVASLAVLHPQRPCPSWERADVVWLVGIGDAGTAAEPLGLAHRCLAPGGRLLVELCTAHAAAGAADLAGGLVRRGFSIVRTERLNPCISLVRGRAPCEPLRHRAA